MTLDPEMKETVETNSVVIGTLLKLLVEKDIFTHDEFNECYNFCVSNWDQYSAECRDVEPPNDN